MGTHAIHPCRAPGTPPFLHVDAHEDFGVYGRYYVRQIPSVIVEFYIHDRSCPAHRSAFKILNHDLMDVPKVDEAEHEKYVYKNSEECSTSGRENQTPLERISQALQFATTRIEPGDPVRSTYDRECTSRPCVIVASIKIINGFFRCPKFQGS